VALHCNLGVGRDTRAGDAFSREIASVWVARHVAGRLVFAAALALSLPGSGDAQTSPAAPAGTEAETPLEEFRRIGKDLYENENPFIGDGPRRELERKLEDPALDDVRRVDLLIQLVRGISGLRMAGVVPAALALVGGFILRYVNIMANA